MTAPFPGVPTSHTRVEFTHPDPDDAPCSDPPLFDRAEVQEANRIAYLDGIRDGQDAGLLVGRRRALDEVAAVQADRRRRRLILAVEGAAVGLGWVLGSLLAQAAQDGAR